MAGEGEGEGEGVKKGRGEGKGGMPAMQATGDLNYLHLAATSPKHRHLMDNVMHPKCVLCFAPFLFMCPHM